MSSELPEHERSELTPHPATDGTSVEPPATPAQYSSVTVDSVSSELGHRLHPTSLMFDVLSHGKTFVIPVALAVFGAASGDLFWSVIAGIMFVPALMVSIFRYFTLRYSIQDGQLVVTKGLFFRSIRTVPVERIQNVDLVQNVLHRMCNVAEVRVETASGTEPEASLRVLSMAQVAKLRTAVFEKRAAKRPPDEESTIQIDSPAEGQVDFAQSGETLLQIPVDWLVRAGLASNRGILMIGILVGLSYQFDLEDRIDLERARQLVPQSLNTVATVVGSRMAVIVVLLMLRLLGIVWYLLRFHGYRLTRYGEDLRISCGLLTKVSATLPRRRVQFISVHRTLLMRWMGLSAIRIETAGGAGKENEDASGTVSRRWFVPVVPNERVAELLAKLRPGLIWDMADLDWKPLARRAGRRLIRMALIQSFVIVAIGLAITRPWGWAAGVVVLPLLIWWAIKRSRSMRYARTEDGVVYRSGVLNRKTSMTFFEKIQTLRVDQSPFDRRWKMAELSVDTAAAGPADHRIKIPLLDEVFAREEYQQLVERAASHQPSHG